MGNNDDDVQSGPVNSTIPVIDSEEFARKMAQMEARERALEEKLKRLARIEKFADAEEKKVREARERALKEKQQPFVEQVEQIDSQIGKIEGKITDSTLDSREISDKLHDAIIKHANNKFLCDTLTPKIEALRRRVFELKPRVDACLSDKISSLEIAKIGPQQIDENRWDWLTNFRKATDRGGWDEYSQQADKARQIRRTAEKIVEEIEEIRERLNQRKKILPEWIKHLEECGQCKGGYTQYCRVFKEHSVPGGKWNDAISPKRNLLSFYGRYNTSGKHTEPRTFIEMLDILINYNPYCIGGIDKVVQYKLEHARKRIKKCEDRLARAKSENHELIQAYEEVSRELQELDLKFKEASEIVHVENIKCTENFNLLRKAKYNDNVNDVRRTKIKDLKSRRDEIIAHIEQLRKASEESEDIDE